MMERRQRAFRLLRYANAAAAVAASALVLTFLSAGAATVPPLGAALLPGHGVWLAATGARPLTDESLTVPGLTQPEGSAPTEVSFTSQGIASISAPTDADLFVALGYVQASFRLTEMDLERRFAEGRLAQLEGPQGVASDKFELTLGLLRTARQEWAAMPRAGAAAQALLAYARGVNDYLAKVRASGDWPAAYSLTGVYPASWTPVDSLAIQGALTQQLDFSTEPLDYELLERSLGAQRTMDWFPVLASSQQSPYDPGPYRDLGITPIGGQLTGASEGGAARSHLSQASAQAAAAILTQASALPAQSIHTAPDSNAWAANGPKTATGGAMLAGDPHLLQTLPSLWYEVALSAPGLEVSGVSVPGVPGVLIGHNAHIAWSMTNAQNQSTLFYDEQTAPGRPGEYFWDGQWRHLQVLHYAIPVRGGATRHLTVDVAVQGPVLTTDGQTVAVDWMGAYDSPDEAAMLAVDAASDWAQFKAALAGWLSPTLNFVYADDRGNIGAIAPGYYPIVRGGDPWLPMPGTGADDVAGVIPYAAVPQVYDPPSHVIVSANQRQVTGAYPYYIGTSANFFDPGYRADTEYAFLDSRGSMRQSSFAALQGDLTDQLATVIVPKLLAALTSTARAAPLTAEQQDAQQVLASWDSQMTTTSAGASIWWTFWTDYLSAVFQPWWTAARVPAHLDRFGLSVGPGQASLDEDLETWTLRDQDNPAFTPPGGPARDAGQAMRAAFDTAVAHLAHTLAGGPGSWAWGRLHTRTLLSVTAAALGYGPRAAGGDLWTPDAAEGGALHSSVGPSWRMIVSWTGPGKPDAQGIYPGGQSEEPGSPLYNDLISDWWSGSYLPMPWIPAGGGATSGSGTVPAALVAPGLPHSGQTSWELRP